MKIARMFLLLAAGALVPGMVFGQANPLWTQKKVKNYLPHMRVPEVQELLQRTDMVIIPVASLEQHGRHLPIGTDYYNGLGRALLVAQRTDVLVAPVLFLGNAPYHMAFEGSMTLPPELIQEVYFQAAKSLVRHGFRRFLILNSHGGNTIISRYIVDRINHETPGLAVELGEAAAPFMRPSRRAAGRVFDRHGGVGETSNALYMVPDLVDMASARTVPLAMPEHMRRMLEAWKQGDETAMMLFRVEGFKPEETGKHTSPKETSSVGVWSERDLSEASAELGREEVDNFVEGAVRFIERWKELRPIIR
ncbi:MAG: creatininase family protein [Gemmatimonadetes bacterium]|nr:creatininase family protein [Gemmatimonadota bacterium]